ncbi:MAG: HAD family hydrolase [archaeon]
MGIEWISFDLDGTLIDLGSVELQLWHEVVPRIYAETHKISYNDAKKACWMDYDEIGSRDTRWYLKEFWFERFGLKQDWREVVKEVLEDLHVYPETDDVLNALKKDYKLALFTNTDIEFAEIKLKWAGLKKYFDQIVSAPSHFNSIKVFPEAYERFLEKLEIPAEKLLHVGDMESHDYTPAVSVGVEALLIDRKNRLDGEHVIRSLSDIKYKLKEFK